MYGANFVSNVAELRDPLYVHSFCLDRALLEAGEDGFPSPNRMRMLLLAAISRVLMSMCLYVIGLRYP